MGSTVARMERLERRTLLSRYQVLDLGTLGGQESTAIDINDQGQVIGYAYTAAGANAAFVFKDANSNRVTDPGEMLDLGALSGDVQSYALGVNDNGIAVGTSVSPTGAKRAVRFEGGETIDLGLGNGSNAYAINDAGDIVGGATFSGNRYQAFARSASGEVLELGTLGGRYSEALGISDAGTVVGYSGLNGGDSAFIRQAGGSMIPIGFSNPPPGFAYGYAWDVNLSGQVVGEGFKGDGAYHAFVYQEGVTQDLGVVGEFVNSMALGINAKGEVVGRLKAASGLTHGFLYDSGMMVDLNDRIRRDSGWVITEARAINDAGYIAANALSSTGQKRAVLLLPDDTPPQVMLAQFRYQTAPRSLVFQFSEDVADSLSPDDLVVTNLSSNQIVTDLSYSFDGQANAATFTFAGDPAEGNYRAILRSDGVTDGAGSNLDGDADGLAGDDFQFDLHFLRGDANYDRSVDFADLAILAQSYNSSGKNWSEGDFDGDGEVGFTDLAALAQNYNTTLPPRPVPPLMMIVHPGEAELNAIHTPHGDDDGRVTWDLLKPAHKPKRDPRRRSSAPAID